MVLSVIVMGSAFAQTDVAKDQPVIVKSGKGDIYKLIVNSSQKSEVTFRVFDDNGRKLFQDKIYRTAGFIKPYNFRKLPEGDYRLEVETNAGIVNQEINHDFDQRFSPSVDINQGEGLKKVDLKVVGANNRPVKVKILNVYGETVFVDEISGLMGFTRTYDLAKAGSQLAFEVRVDNQVFTKSL